MPIKPRILLSALPLAAVLAACESPSGTLVTNGESGNTVSLAYTGGVTGSFAASGTFNSTAAPSTQTFAFSTVGTDGTLEVVAYRQRGGNRFDFATITVPDAAVGNVAVDVCPGETCASVSLALDVGQAAGSIATHSCRVETGTIRVTALSATRATGTVTGTGVCLPGNGGASIPFQLTSGSFNVQVRAP
jgi:hypothetical protein